MPSYDLACESCDHPFEAFRQGFLRDEDRVCPECGAPGARQLFTGFVTARPARGRGRRADGRRVRRRGRGLLRRLLRLRALGATVSTTARPESTQLVVRLRRAEGQLRGVQRMLEEGADCQKVLTQLAAVKAAVDQVGLHLISSGCARAWPTEKRDCAEQFEDAVATFLRFATLAK